MKWVFLCAVVWQRRQLNGPLEGLVEDVLGLQSLSCDDSGERGNVSKSYQGG